MADKIKEIIGLKFNKLTALEIVGVASDGLTLVSFKCDCGAHTIKRATNVKRGITKSCDKCRRRYNKHGLYYHPLYSTWNNIVGRISNPNNKHYKNYGGRGISIDSGWRESFQSFLEWSLRNGWSEALEIDRIDNNGDYSPSNCRWVSRKDNVRNRRLTVMAEFNGIMEPFATLCERFNIEYDKYRRQFKTGGSFENILKIENHGC